jgi:hypothetical protein
MSLTSTKPLTLSSLSSFKDSLISSTKNTINNITDGANDLLTSEIRTPSFGSTSTSNPTIISSASESSGSFFSSMTWQTWIIIILVLALLGLNIFTYLAKGTAELTQLIDTIFGPILKLFGYATIQTTKQVIEKGTDGINAVSNTAVSGLDKLEKAASGKQAESSLPVQNANDDNSIDHWQENPLDKALHNAQLGGDQSVEPDEANSNIQYSGKSGYCYIGDSNGVRTCAKVGVNDTCMSGDIFPSNEICINPNLRV